MSASMPRRATGDGHDVLIAVAVARRWTDVLSNALEPGWVATRMGGPGAPDDLEAGRRSVWRCFRRASACQASRCRSEQNGAGQPLRYPSEDGYSQLEITEWPSHRWHLG
jgi:hypothetical protein